MIDPNRTLCHTSLIPEKSDTIIIPGNAGLSDLEREKRIKHFHYVFHQGVKGIVDEKMKTGQVPILLGIHSFTPEMEGHKRPWPISIMWNKDTRASDVLIEGLMEQALDVGGNDPYSGKELFHTMDYQAGERGLPHAIIEIRQDQIDNKQGVDDWVKILIPVIKSLLQIEDFFNSLS